MKQEVSQSSGLLHRSYLSRTFTQEKLVKFGDSGAEVNCVKNIGSTRRTTADADSFIDLATLPYI